MTTKPRTVRNASPANKRRTTARLPKRARVSTTVAAENFTFLEMLVKTRRIASMADALDLAISRLRHMDNRHRLEDATAAYYDSLTPEAQAEEEKLARLLQNSTGGIDFDREP